MEELICSYQSALRVYKSPYEIQKETGISRSSVQRIALTCTYKSLLFCAKFGADLINISKVTSCRIMLFPDLKILKDDSECIKILARHSHLSYILKHVH